jgi:LysR family transcriptional regulator, glycine cleavage system transcriptional activator
MRHITQQPLPRVATSRPIALDNLRTFAAVARGLSFRTAAADLHLTQSAVSRRIQALEQELGCALFVRDTRNVMLTREGETLLQTVRQALDGIDRTVVRLRAQRQRRHVSVNTFSTFATLWLLPRLHEFQRDNPDIDIRIVANDALVDVNDPETDVALRLVVNSPVPPHAERLFGEVIMPVTSPMLVKMAKAGKAPSLQGIDALALHTWLDEDDDQPGSACTSWQHWLESKGHGELVPRRLVSVNYGHQGIQAAVAGHGLAMGRLGLVHLALERGELVEVLGRRDRLRVNAAYWMVPMLGAVLRPELVRFLDWVRQQAAHTREAVGEGEPPTDALGASQHRAKGNSRTTRAPVPSKATQARTTSKTRKP